MLYTRVMLIAAGCALVLGGAFALGCATATARTNEGAVSKATDASANRAGDATPIQIGESFTIASVAMGETRRINVFRPTIYGERIDGALPVLCVLDGGMAEDFLHIAGLVQVLVSNGGMRAMLVVGIENTQRRRDLTGPTSNADDLKIAPVVGGSAAFRRFIREEVLPSVRARYGTSQEAAIIGESLAGLFVMETLALEPELFDAYLAIDPSLWWNNAGLVKSAGAWASRAREGGRRVFVASSNEPEMARLAGEVARAIGGASGSGTFQHVAMPGESHATVYHPGALAGLRDVLAPVPQPKSK